jgi:hypothetical protein
MVGLAMSHFTARKPATPLIPVVQGSANGGRNGSGLTTDVEDIPDDAALGVVHHL